MRQRMRTLTGATALAVVLSGTLAAGHVAAATINKGQVPAANFRWDVPFGCVPTRNTFMLDEDKPANNCLGISNIWGPGWVQVLMPGTIGGYQHAITRMSQNYHEAAYWWPTIRVAGNYEVWVGWRASHNRATATPYLVYADDNTYLYRVNQYIDNSEYVGGRWARLGTHQFAKRAAAASALVTDTTDSVRKAAGFKIPPGFKGYVKVYNDPSPAVHSEGIDGVGFKYVGPVAPTGLTATGNGVNGINLTWTQPYGAAQGAVTKFQIIRGATLLATTSTNATRYTDTRAVGGYNYTYKVRALAYVNGATRYSAWSSAKSGSWTDTTADQFTFTDQIDVQVNTQVTSNTITVSGLGANVTVGIAVTGGEYSVNGGAFTAANGTVKNGDTVQLRVTSSVNVSTAVNAVLTIGIKTDTFTVTTIGPT